jgi:hypothetical protein
MGKNEMIETLRIINTGELPYLQEKVDYLRKHLSRLEYKKKDKEYNLSVLDKRINELAYSEYSKYQISNEYSPKPLPYKEDGIYSNSDIEDKNIRPVSNMRLMRMDINYESVDKAAFEIISASADEVRRFLLKANS